MRSNLTEEQNRAIAAMFMSKGWELVKAELQTRRIQAARNLVYNSDRARDEEYRANVKAIDFLLNMEKELFTPRQPETQEPTIEEPIADRYK